MILVRSLREGWERNWTLQILTEGGPRRPGAQQTRTLGPREPGFLAVSLKGVLEGPPSPQEETRPRGRSRLFSVTRLTLKPRPEPRSPKPSQSSVLSPHLMAPPGTPALEGTREEEQRRKPTRIFRRWFLSPVFAFPYRKPPAYKPSSWEFSKRLTCVWFQQGTRPCASKVRSEWSCGSPSVSYYWWSFSSSISLRQSLTLLACSLNASPCVPAVALYYCT